MKKSWTDGVYSTNLASDDKEGWTALQLSRERDGQTELVARIIFWDAEGQFSLEVLVRELPLTIVEELIAEAKRAIKIT